MLQFDGKTVFVTGGGSGIGATTVELFVERGARVISTDICFSSGNPSKINFKQNPTKIRMDVRSLSEIKYTIERTLEKFDRLDIVINCAGILTTKPILEIRERDWDEVFATNLKGTFFVCQSALRYMIQRKTGCIVNIASISGKVGGIMAGADYSASKAGVICLTKSLAKAGAPYGIRVNSIAPGGINTSMINQYYDRFPERVKETIDETPLKRFGEATEVANTIVFLASNEASYITGACIDVNGGALMD